MNPDVPVEKKGTSYYYVRVDLNPFRTGKMIPHLFQEVCLQIRGTSSEGVNEE